MQAPISSSANWRYTYDLSTQVHLTSGSTYPILARLAHGPTRADGWFDLGTSAPGHPFAYAVAEATAELMVAAVCLVIGLRTQQGCGRAAIR